MTAAEALSLGWQAALPMVGFLTLLGVWLLGLAVLGEATR